MIFDTIFDFYLSLFVSDRAIYEWELIEFPFPTSSGFTYIPATSYFAVLCTVVTIICGIFALFRILGGILKLFKV